MKAAEQAALSAVEEALRERSALGLSAAVRDVGSMEELLGLWKAVEDGDEQDEQPWARVWWDGSDDDEAAVQRVTGATLRCLPNPLDAHGNSGGTTGVCVASGRPTQSMAIFTRAY